MSTSSKTKALIRDIHLWSGLIAGIVIFLICLSGTVLTFQKEFEELFRSELTSLSISTSDKKVPLFELMKSVEDESSGKVQRIILSPDRNYPVIFTVKTSPNDRRGKPYYVHPVTKKILNDPDERPLFFFFFFRLHRWLLLDPEIGSAIVGGTTLIFILLLFSGLYLWWPKTKARLKSSLKVSFKGSWKKINYDLHNSLGFYSFIFLLVMALTGLCWSFDWYRSGLSQILGTQVFGERREAPLNVIPGPQKVSLEDIIRTANKTLPYPGMLTLALPVKTNSALVVMKTPVSSFTLNYTDKIQFNSYDGTVLKIEKFADKPLGRQISSLIRHLHTGEFFGLFSKIIYFITCLIATTLPLTGTLIWFNKFKRKRIK